MDGSGWNYPRRKWNLDSGIMFVVTICSAALSFCKRTMQAEILVSNYTIALIEWDKTQLRMWRWLVEVLMILILPFTWCPSGAPTTSDSLWLGFKGRSNIFEHASRGGGRPAPATPLSKWRFPDISAVKSTLHFAKGGASRTFPPKRITSRSQ